MPDFRQLFTITHDEDKQMDNGLDMGQIRREMLQSQQLASLQKEVEIANEERELKLEELRAKRAQYQTNGSSEVLQHLNNIVGQFMAQGQEQEKRISELLVLLRQRDEEANARSIASLEKQLEELRVERKQIVPVDPLADLGRAVDTVLALREKADAIVPVANEDPAQRLVEKRLDYEQEQWRTNAQWDREQQGKLAEERIKADLEIAKLRHEEEMAKAKNIEGLLDKLGSAIAIGIDYLRRPGEAGARVQHQEQPEQQATPCPTCKTPMHPIVGSADFYCSRCDVRFTEGVPQEALKEESA